MSRQFLTPVLLPGNPTLPLQATPKQYVDALVGGGGASGFTFNQDATPTATAVGQTWYQTSTGDSYVWTNDGTSTQWVQFAPGSGGGGGSGFTYVQETAPIPSKVGDTWFDLSTAATGGTSWVAVEESPGGEKVWVQFAPGTQAAFPPYPRFRIVGGSNQSVPASAVTIATYMTEQYDPFNMQSGGFAVVPNGWGGRWMFEFAARFPSPSTGVRAAWVTLNNSIRYAQTSVQAASGGETLLTGAASILMIPGDWAAVSVFHTHSGAFFVNASTDDYFQGYWIGPY